MGIFNLIYLLVLKTVLPPQIFICHLELRLQAKLVRIVLMGKLAT